MKYQPFIDGITVFDLEPFQRKEFQNKFLALVKKKIYPLDDGDTETALTLTGNEKVIIEVVAGIIATKLEADKRRGQGGIKSAKKRIKSNEPQAVKQRERMRERRKKTEL